MVIKKSSHCWLLKQPRISSDQLQRFISNYDCKIKTKSVEKQTQQTKASTSKKLEITSDEDSLESGLNEI